MGTIDLGFDIGDIIQVEWEGIWFAAHVLSVDGQGNVNVQYLGFDESWNELVPLERTRIPGEEEKKATSLDQLKGETLTLFLTNDKALKGMLVDISQEYIVIQTEQRRTLFVSKQHVVYLESGD